SSYWDTTVASAESKAGSSTVGTGLTTAQMQDINSFQTTYAGWDFQNVWAPPSSGYYPQLYASSYIAVIWANSASMTYGGTVPTLTGAVYGLHSSDPTSLFPITSVTTSATSSSNAGSYAINATTVSYPYTSLNGVVPNTLTTVHGGAPYTVING